MRKVLWAGTALALVACSNNSPSPRAAAPAAPSSGYAYQPTYGQPTYGQPTYGQPAYGPSTYGSTNGGYAMAPAMPSPPPPPSYVGTSAAPPMMAPPAASGPFRWLASLQEAQAEARRENKLILVGTTKPGCGLCEKFRHQIAPQAATQLAPVAVGYMYDITNYDTTQPNQVRLDQVLRNNLVGAKLMPLVGFVTADLQWVHGFSGPTDVNQFLGDVARARQMRPRTLGFLPRAAAPAALAQGGTYGVNEYGEYEWSPAAAPTPDVEPIDAIGSDDALLADASAPVEPVPAPSLPHDDPVVAVAPAPAPSPAVVPAAPPRGTPSLGGVEGSVRADLPPVAGTRAWAKQRLAMAFDLIGRGDLDAARTTLTEVIEKAPDDGVAREAFRGTVAIHNARRLLEANASERASLAERARRDLDTTMWAELFRS